MKLRLHDDSLRLRLDRDEVDAIGRGEAVETSARIPGGRTLRWRLEVGGDEVTALLADDRVTVRLPAAVAAHWAGDDTEVSVRGRPSTADGASLAILVEKDFECLEPRAGESQRNRFANPKKTG
jgi:hypothetical protein